MQIKENSIPYDMNIAVLISGGVDSSVVVHQLCEQGYKPALFYIRIGRDDVDYMDCSAEEDMEICTAVAHKYGLKLELIDLHREYWDKVAVYAIDKIRHGFTPNPDVMCNRLIKFGCFEEKVGKDFDMTATGHYATTHIINGKTWLGTAIDPVKDQTDFLAQITYMQVKKLMFPLGNLMKTEVRQIAANVGLPSAKRKDSQGICFLNNINYNDFVRRFLGEQEGPIVELETGKILGKHKGFWFHTIGQRKGLIAAGYPIYVKEIKAETNEVVLGEEKSLYTSEIRCYRLNFMSIPGLAPGEEIRARVKIRYHHAGEQATILPDGEENVRIIFDAPVRAATPGQSAVFYDEENRVIGGGIISKK